MKCRLLVNVIAGGKSYPRDSVVDDQILSERQKTEEYIAYDLENKDGNVVLLLRDLSYQSEPIRGLDGVPTSYPVMLIAGETMALYKVPASKRQDLKEGLDFKTNWSFEDQAELRRVGKEAYLAQFQNEPEPAVHAAWRRK